MRDVDSDSALEIVVTTTHGRSSFSSETSEVVFLEPSDFVHESGRFSHKIPSNRRQSE